MLTAARFCDPTQRREHRPAHAPLMQLAIALTLAIATLALNGCTLWTAMSNDQDQPPLPRHRVIESTASDSASDTIDDTDLFQPDSHDPHPAVLAREQLSVPAMVAGPPPADYIVGPNDVLYVNVFGQPEMGSPIVPADNRALGSRVDGSGRIQLPTIGPVYVAGLTVGQVQKKVQTLYGKIINKPWVVVEILEHRSHPLYLIGRFNTPGVVYMDRPTNLAQAIALGDGLESTAHLRGARLLRGDKTLPVDVYSLLRSGAMDQNVWLQPNDTIYVPDESNLVVFVLGQVETPGPIPMIDGRLSLTQALASAGGFKKANSELSSVRIIRSLSTTRGEMILVDLEKIVDGEVLVYGLMPGDIVYVPWSELGDWNESVAEILPTLQLFSGLLNPFVQIKFLSDND